MGDWCWKCHINHVSAIGKNQGPIGDDIVRPLNCSHFGFQSLRLSPCRPTGITTLHESLPSTLLGHQVAIGDCREELLENPLQPEMLGVDLGGIDAITAQNVPQLLFWQTPEGFADLSLVARR